MAMVLAETLPEPLAAEGGDLGERPVARDAQGRRRRDLHRRATSRGSRRRGSAASSCGAAGRARARSGSSPRSATWSSSATSTCATRPGPLPDRLPHHLLPQRLDLLRRGRADGRCSNRLAQHLRPGGWLVMGNGEILPGVPASLRKHSPSIFRKEGDRPWLGAPSARRQPPASPPIEVLVVDDSAVVRQRLKSIIESDPRFRVVLAADPYEAVAHAQQVGPRRDRARRRDAADGRPDLPAQADAPAPDAGRALHDQAERAVTALEMGAIEVIAKPDWRDAGRLAEWSQNLLESIRNAARAGRLPFREDRPVSATDPRHTADVILPQRRLLAARPAVTERIIVVGVSTGGVQALQQLLAGFPADSPGHRHRPAHAARLHRGVRPAAEQRPEDRDRSRRGPAPRADPAGPRPGHPGRHPRPDPPDRRGLPGRAGRRARRSAGTGPASRSCSARPPRPPARSPPA